MTPNQRWLVLETRRQRAFSPPLPWLRGGHGDQELTDILALLPTWESPPEVASVGDQRGALGRTQSDRARGESQPGCPCHG